MIMDNAKWRKLMKTPSMRPGLKIDGQLKLSIAIIFEDDSKPLMEELGN